MSFKIPYFQPQVTINGVFDWFRTFMGRWSGSDLILARHVSIGAWDMSSTPSVTIEYATDIVLKRIVGVNVIIVDDAETTKFDPSVDGFDQISLDATDITLTRTAAGFFDTLSFDDASINRGEIVIWYSV